MIRFHTFGDSHASEIMSHWGKIKNVKIIPHAIGGKLAYTFGSKCFEVVNIKNHGVQEGDYVCFCFGETDCRCHVHKHTTETRPYKDVVEEIANLYVSAIKRNVEQFKNVKTVIYNIVPPVRFIKTNSSHPFPYLGTDDERKVYYSYMNKILKEKCLENGYQFLDIYDKYLDEDGFLDKKYSDGNCHIIDPIFVNEWLKNNLLNK